MTSELITKVYVLFIRLTGLSSSPKQNPRLLGGFELSQPVIGRIAPPLRMGDSIPPEN
jgi:hypothetical protein